MQKKKRHHYVPRFYLNGFTESDDPLIMYVYEKGCRNIISTTAERVAYENHFYTFIKDDGSQDTNTVEDFLHTEVESPALPIIRKIRNREMITADEKGILSKYIAYLIKRVPRGKQRTREAAPKIVQSMSEKIHREIEIAISGKPDRVEFYEKRRAEIDRVLIDYAADVPSSILMGILQYPSPRLTEAIRSMTWRFLVSRGDLLYLTSDNPVFYDESLGIGKQFSEVSVPISRDVALWMSWRADIHDGFVFTTSQAIKEINRRTVSRATKYVFAAQEADWIVTLVNKTHHKLTRLL